MEADPEVRHLRLRVPELLQADVEVELLVLQIPALVPVQLGVVLDDLIEAVNKSDMEKYMVVLVMSPCGFMAVVSVPLVPDYGVCAKLGVEHRELPLMVFNIDNTD